MIAFYFSLLALLNSGHLVCADDFGAFLGITKDLDRSLAIKVRFNLGAYMRAHRVTIAALAERMNVTHARVRQIRSMDRVPFLVAFDYLEAVEALSMRADMRPEAQAQEAA